MQARSTPFPISFPSTLSSLCQVSSTYLDPDTAEGAAPARQEPGSQVAQMRCSWRQRAAKWLEGHWSRDPGSARQARELRCPCSGRDPQGGQLASRPGRGPSFSSMPPRHTALPLCLQIPERSRVAEGERARQMPGTAQPGWTENAGSPLFPVRLTEPFLSGTTLP